MKIIPMFLLIAAEFSYAQVTIYYDDDCNITMRELASHYRIAKVDTALRKFTGEVKEFWKNDSVISTLSYDVNGNRNGLIELKKPNGGLKLMGQYLDGNQSGKWRIYNEISTTDDFSVKNKNINTTIDSVELCLTKKENFATSQFIRKADYREIYSLINKSYWRHSKVNSKKDNQVYAVVELRPHFPGGMETLAKLIGAFITYPEEALKNNIKGQVVVEFTITPDGSTTDFKIIKGLGYGCDEEAIRVLKLLPDWIPGYQNGRAVKSKLKLPITLG